MIIYESNKVDFVNIVDNNMIAETIKNIFIKKGISGGTPSEYASWDNSLQRMKNIIADTRIPDDVHIAIEYTPKMVGRRIDFMVMGHDQDDNKNFLVIELKQWQNAAPVEGKNDIVETYVGQAMRQVSHPSYQAMEYLSLLTDYNSNIESEKIHGYACSYLHNADKEINKALLDKSLFKYIVSYPLFMKSDVSILKEKIIHLTSKGKGKEILYIIENGKIKPTKKLKDAAKSILNGSQEYILYETQKLVYENILSKVNESNNVFIINGGPGTGKSVLGINLLSKIIQNNKSCYYVVPNAAFKHSIQKSISRNSVNAKFLVASSGGFFDWGNKTTIDWVIVDEAHRLKRKGAFMYKGENQIDDIMKASSNVIFFVDDRQLINSLDIGSVDKIIQTAKDNGKNIFFDDDYKLTIQFRCTGSNGYINAVLNCLQLEQTGNRWLNESDQYDFQIYDDPNDMFESIKEKNNQGHLSRVLAGYSWKWKSKNEQNREDIHFINDVKMDEYNFSAPWNYQKDANWIADENSINEIGCIHTSQGLELDYCGVIIGNELTIDENGNLVADIKNYYDATGKKNLKDKPEQLTQYIKNIYYVLMTRGQKGTYLFVRDKKLREYFKKFIVK